jgi:hypothetical protein
MIPLTDRPSHVPSKPFHAPPTIHLFGIRLRNLHTMCCAAFGNVGLRAWISECIANVSFHTSLHAIHKSNVSYLAKDHTHICIIVTIALSLRSHGHHTPL